jgi:hypothetical protein
MKHHGPAPTLRQMRAVHSWLWLSCAKCDHTRPVPIVHLMIAVGIDTSSDRVRAQARCRACGHRGARTQVPSFVDSQTGSAPFPYRWLNWAERRA